MDYLIRKVSIVDPGGKHHGKVVDVWVKDGIIREIGREIRRTGKTRSLQAPNSMLSGGWIDIGCVGGEPGLEHRETLRSLALSGAAGGFTGLCMFPNTRPAIQSKSEVNFIRSKSVDLPIHILPIGAVSKGCIGQELAEILQMREAGAIAFSDGMAPIQNSGLMMRALEYLKLVPGGLLINQSLDHSLAGKGQVHEGPVSTLLGLLGIPLLAETTFIHRDLALLRYTASRLLVHKLSGEESVAILRAAKKQLSGLFASVSIFNLVADASRLENLDANYKLSPPLRDASDRKALVRGVAEGTIDCIVSDHTPWDPESKDLEFQSAAFGSLSLQTCFRAYCTHLLDELGIDRWVEMQVHNTRSMLHLPVQHVEEGCAAELSWFVTGTHSLFTDGELHSLSRNCPYPGSSLRGKVLGVFSKGKFTPDGISEKLA
ncbi:MAG: Dihydroorotase [Saprospiraceae bacterium]|jgi:dihydroorotase|nr:Dihydroorotase [Saprospiraceae bacterium]